MSPPRSFLAGAVALLGFVTASFAQVAPRTFNSYYFFGDSLTDSGNTFALTGQPPPPYFQGRFSNGITYAEYLVPGLAAAAPISAVRPNLNFAFAGATAAPGSAVPSLAQQLGMFQGRGITPNSNDMFVILAGANDLLNTVSNPATQNGQALINSGVGASTAVANAVQSLATLGARNIFVLNLPDISRTARFVTGSGVPAASLVQQGAFAFNNDIRGRVAALNLPAGTNVTVFDLSSIFNALLNNAAALGFTNTTQEYLGLLMAGANPGDVNNYIFYDGIHPTTRAHRVLANALTEALNPHFSLGTAATLGTATLTAADMTADAVASRLDLVRYGAPERGAHGFVSYSFKDGSRDWSGYQNEFSYDASVFTGGFDLNVAPGILAGVALAKESVSADLSSRAGSFKYSGESVTAYAQWKSGSWFADVAANYGAFDLRSIGRTTSLGLSTAGESDGDRWGAAVRIGGDFGFENLHVTPFVGLRYTKAKIDGYTEGGVSGLNFSYDDQTAKAVDALIGASADWRVQAGLPLVIGLSAVFQKDMADDVREFSGRLANTVAATTRIGVSDGLDQSLKLGVRVSGSFSKRWGWTAGYQAEIRDDGDTASQYSIGVQTGF